MTPYKYTNSSMSMVGKIPKDGYIDLFQETLNEQFYNSSDWWTIQEEYPELSKEFVDIDVRINHVINAETGVKLGDDWKTILFKEVSHTIHLGRFYFFDNNYWILVNTEVIKNLTATATLKRCNNVLRWIDEKTGAVYSEPCTIEVLIKEPRDYSTAGSSVVTPSGFLQIQTQFNSRTNTIKPNQRFLFGNKDNWIGYKVVGTGTNNFNNLSTEDNMSVGILRLDMVANYINAETDDLVNGFADVTQNVYTVNIPESNITSSIGATYPLSAFVTMNGNSVTRDLVWSSSNVNIATVSDTGLVKMISNGSCTITVSIKDNPAQDTCGVTVTAVPAQVKKIVISPQTNFVFEGTTSVYSAYLYIDGVIQPDVLTITCNPNSIPVTSYVFTQTDSNHFTISNILKNLTSKLTITGTAGLVSGSFDIFLKGAY